VKVARIIVESGPLRGKGFTLPSKESVTIGRESDCFIRLPDGQVSRLHCVLTPAADPKGTQYLLDDQKSRNGTYINGERIEKKRSINPGDMIQLGETCLSFVDEEEDPLLGTTVAGYRIEQRLGRGGMGTVYKARQISLDRTVALKILSRSLTQDRNFVKRFLDEARSAGKLNHPNVVQVHDVGHHGDVYYLSMEFMAGSSLQELLDKEGPLPPERIIPMILDATQALIWAEQNGIVHRDIKPDNLMLDADGAMKICDFGIAVDRRKSKTFFEKEKIVGTPLYMAPEQAMGSKSDHRVDVYALGATLYTALSGSHPYHGETPVEILLKKMKEHPVSLAKAAPSLPPGLVAIVEKMMARDPEKRYQTASEVHAALSEALKVYMATSKPRRRLGLRYAALAAAMLLASGAFSLYWQRHRAREPAGGLEKNPPMVKELDRSGEKALAADPSKDGNPAPVTETEASNGKGSGKGEIPRSENAQPEGLDASSRRDLVAIRDRWKSGSSSAQTALKELKQFEEAHPEERWKDPVENVRKQVESEFAKAREAGLAELGKLVAEKTSPLAAQEKFREALDLLAQFSQGHAESKEDVALEEQRLSDLALEALARGKDAAAELVRKGKFKEAKEALSRLEGHLPAPLDAGARVAIKDADLEEETYGEVAKKLDDAEKAARDAFQTLEFEAVERALSAIPASSHPLLSPRREETARDIKLFQGITRRLTAEVKRLVEGKSYLPFPLTEDKPGEKAPNRRLAEISGIKVNLQPKGGSLESHTLACFPDETLLGLLKPPAGGDAREAARDPETLEAVGILLLHADGPGRAWKFLLDPSLGDAAQRTYRERLGKAILKKLEGESVELHKRLAALRPQDEKESLPLWEKELTLVAGLLREGALISAETELRADLAAAYLECKRHLLSPQAPRILFHAAKVEATPGGAVRLSYDFKSEEQIQDFYSAGDPKGELRLAAKGTLLIQGEYRYLRGNPFQNRLRVQGTALAYTKENPNVNFAFWTRDNHPLPKRAWSPRISSLLEGPSVLVFGMGFLGTTGGTYNGMPYFDFPSGEVYLPANVILVGRRTRGSSIVDDLQCLWGRKAAKSYKPPSSYEVTMTADGRLSWQFAGERIAPPSSIDSNLAQDVRAGSITFWTLKDKVYLGPLVIEGDLDPSWPEEEMNRQALEDLRGIEPAYPFLNLDRPQEETGRGGLGCRVQPGRRLFFDGFSGKLEPAWKILHEDASHYSLARKPGALAIITQRGGFLGDTKDYKNLFLIETPAGGEDFEITTRVLSFKPQENFQQVMLLCFDDDENYIKCGLEWNTTKRRFALTRAVTGNRVFLGTDAPQNLTTLWLSMRKRGKLYSLLTSADGETFAPRSELYWGDGKPKFLGFSAHNSTTNAPEIDASFDFFEVRSLLSASEPGAKK
jgi:serine/threonine protein kinase/regulation of enolase protein 1 (concanavalin A-like superfamily)